ncbi:Os11g0439300 [Oryza sativa Japonica Group]|jgi:hypothetical protein|uniref:Os11g0439300 protein n=1 Tax=Oryza sativa subsp. japonica TaxID=39947 RepID=A0A0P0Y1P7_ORYSJ|nr:hypothetical protein EE612_055252 [Oryza sativa]BAT13864.1 Os11g0439300 [Oryza sativa Japonica Group]
MFPAIQVKNYRFITCRSISTNVSSSFFFFAFFLCEQFIFDDYVTGELCIWGLKKDIMILLIPLDDLSLVIPSKDGFRAVREFSVARDANINLSSLANAFLISRQQILCTLG